MICKTNVIISFIFVISTLRVDVILPCSLTAIVVIADLHRKDAVILQLLSL